MDALSKQVHGICQQASVTRPRSIFCPHGPPPLCAVSEPKTGVYTPLPHTSVFSLLLMPYPLPGWSLTLPIPVTADKHLPHKHPAPLDWASSPAL